MSNDTRTVQAYRASLLHFHADPAVAEHAHAWHEDGLRPPPLAYELASNAFGTQAFCLRRHLAVQFHPEVTPDIVAGWASLSGSRLAETGQTAEDLVAASEEHAAANAARAARLFDGFAARAGIAARVA